MHVEPHTPPLIHHCDVRYWQDHRGLFLTQRKRILEIFMDGCRILYQYIYIYVYIYMFVLKESIQRDLSFEL